VALRALLRGGRRRGTRPAAAAEQLADGDRRRRPRPRRLRHRLLLRSQPRRRLPALRGLRAVGAPLCVSLLNGIERLPIQVSQVVTSGPSHSSHGLLLLLLLLLRLLHDCCRVVLLLPRRGLVLMPRSRWVLLPGCRWVLRLRARSTSLVLQRPRATQVPGLQWRVSVQRVAWDATASRRPVLQPHPCHEQGRGCPQEVSGQARRGGGCVTRREKLWARHWVRCAVG
jgi:hypothetical protein